MLIHICKGAGLDGGGGYGLEGWRHCKRSGRGREVGECSICRHRGSDRQGARSRASDTARAASCRQPGSPEPPPPDSPDPTHILTISSASGGVVQWGNGQELVYQTGQLSELA